MNKQLTLEKNLSYRDILSVKHLLLRHYLVSQDDLTTKEEAGKNKVMGENMPFFPSTFKLHGMQAPKFSYFKYTQQIQCFSSEQIVS